MLITLPSKLNISTLKSLIKSWPEHGEEVELHFNARQWATPTGMVGLACLIDKLRKAGGTIHIEFNDCDAIGYWERMGFFREVSLVPPDNYSGIPHAANGRFAEMRRVGDIDLVDEITQELVAATQTLEEGIKTFSHILSEAMNNVCQHSGAYGFSAAQYWKKTGEVEFCIADSGQGLFSALSHSHKPKDEADAIRLALKVGVTSRSPNFQQSHMRNRGVGLSCIEKLVNANGGTLEIWTGLGRFKNINQSAYISSNSWTGTLIAVNMQRDHLTADFRTVMQQLTAELRLVEADKKSSIRRVR